VGAQELTLGAGGNCGFGVVGMDYSERWRIIEPLGEGGQGKVYRVSRLDVKLEDECINSLREVLKNVAYGGREERRQNFAKFRGRLAELLKWESPSNQGALKVLHEPKDARDADLAPERIKREIEAMSKNLHPNLVKILDHDLDSRWYVSQFYPNGTLANKKEMFKGDFLKALKAMRPLVKGVAISHQEGYVHRDIKPQNVFLNANNDLILGDFGLIYFEDDQHARVSATYENVGSRDWMPAWAMGMRIEDIKPNFDIFSLGKVLWSMVSGKSILPLWYFNKDNFNVEQLFPKSRGIQFANPLFAKCIVEDEGDCMKDGKVLLSEIDSILESFEVGIDKIKSEKGSKRIGEIEEKILVSIAKTGYDGYCAEELAPELGFSATRTEYYLEQMDKVGLLDRSDYVGSPSNYSLSEDGRAYLVENNLI